MEPIEGSETSAIVTQTPRKHPKENILHTKLSDNFFQFYNRPIGYSIRIYKITLTQDIALGVLQFILRQMENISFFSPIVDQKSFVLLLELRARDTNCDAVRQL
jgi:hypothetical protein